MRKINKFNNFNLIKEKHHQDFLNRRVLPKSKVVKVTLYTHDDMDGIYTALCVKSYLLKRWASESLNTYIKLFRSAKIYHCDTTFYSM